MKFQNPKTTMFRGTYQMSSLTWPRHDLLLFMVLAFQTTRKSERAEAGRTFSLNWNYEETKPNSREIKNAFKHCEDHWLGLRCIFGQGSVFFWDMWLPNGVVQILWKVRCCLHSDWSVACKLRGHQKRSKTLLGSLNRRRTCGGQMSCFPRFDVFTRSFPDRFCKEKLHKTWVLPGRFSIFFNPICQTILMCRHFSHLVGRTATLTGIVLVEDVQCRKDFCNVMGTDFLPVAVPVKILAISQCNKWALSKISTGRFLSELYIYTVLQLCRYRLLYRSI